MIRHLHFLSTSFFLSQWIPVDWAVPLWHPWVVFIWAAFSAIFFAAGGDIGGSQLNFWVFNLVLVVEGVLVSYAFQIILSSPSFLRTFNGWEAMFIKFLFFGAAYALSQAFYAVNPPPGSPWGLILTILVNAVVILLVWFFSYDNPIVNGSLPRPHIYYLWWIFFDVVLKAWFFLVYTGLDEVYVALIAGGATFLMVLLLLLIIIPWWSPDRRKAPLV